MKGQNVKFSENFRLVLCKPKKNRRFGLDSALSSAALRELFVSSGKMR